jgi:hypothetical protein
VAIEAHHATLRERLRKEWHVLERMQITLDYDQEVHFKAYQDMYERAWRGLRAPVGPATLAEAVAPRAAGPEHAAVADQLRNLLGDRLSLGDGTAAAVDRIVDALVRYVRAEQAILASTLVLHDTINARLERPRPSRALVVEDFRVNYGLSSGAGAFPYIFELLERELGIRVACTASSVSVTDRRAS